MLVYKFMEAMLSLKLVKFYRVFLFLPQIVRDTSGVPEVLTRLETPSSSSVVETLEYDS